MEDPKTFIAMLLNSKDVKTLEITGWHTPLGDEKPYPKFKITKYAKENKETAS